MSSFLFRQVSDCSTCGDCLNGGDFPDYYASVVGIKRFGGMPPLPVWVEVWAGGFSNLKAARPSGTNDAVYRTFEFTKVFPNDSGGTSTFYNKFIWHPVMGDYYWGFESRLSSPARSDDYTYEWKLGDSTSSGSPVITINDPDGTGMTLRPNISGSGFDNTATIDTYTWDTLSIHDSITSATWALSDPYTMQSGLTDVTNSAQSACDEIDIASDNVTVTIDPAGGVANQTSNLTDSFASPRSADVVRVAARRDSGVIMVTLPITFCSPAARSDFGTIVVRFAEEGNAVPTSCNMASEFGGSTGLDIYMWSWLASKIKFALKTEGWCFKTWKLQTTPVTFELGPDPFPCNAINGTLYDTVSLKWVVYAEVTIPPCCSEGDTCEQPGDFVLTAALVTCSSYSHGSGNHIGLVSDLPEPCASYGAPCVGDIWYYDYTMCPLLGFIAPDCSNCGTNCDCGTTTRNVFPNITVPPSI